MWPRRIKWNELRFGVEIEFIGGRPSELELLPGWVMALDELQIDDGGEESGSELQTPPLAWADRDQLRVMLARLREQGARMNWSCGLHVHVGIEPWGEALALPLVDAALASQDALRALMTTSKERLVYCPPVTEEMRDAYRRSPCREALCRKGRPQSHRCGINAAAWYDNGTVEIRYANGSLNEDEILRVVELCLRFTAAVGEGRELPASPRELAAALDAAPDGYPPPIPVPRWYRERIWLEDALLPAVDELVQRLVPGGELHHALPVEDGILIAIEGGGGLLSYVLKPPADGWQIVRQVVASPPSSR
ncbi:hypothetical protein GZH47_20210 [Paenibacillus rhizovicinus]|uniref:Amidoligase enzyme n=1 Tax=Paenibacillus rhizovicinus TaxID=2704463 RepID=A0A6C0P373_9BACL|nr:amidoligase family protein [Paenibacillus rhizovicinus]QHW32905.1 hypothetical protein GZH47_20210 [Paenibacillus rhizovicinus]